MYRPITLLMMLISCFSYSFGQKVNTALSRTEIVLSEMKGGKLPFDEPFKLILDKGDASRVLRALVYKLQYVDGKRHFYKMVNSPSSTCDKSAFKPDLMLEPDTTNKKITLNFPALKPNQNFDISIHLKRLPSSTSAFLEFTDAVKHEKPNLNSLLETLIAPYKNTNYDPVRTSTPYVNLGEFKSKLYANLKAILEESVDYTKYKTLLPYSNAEINQVQYLADNRSLKIKDIFYLNPNVDHLKKIGIGLLSYSNYQNKPTRDANFADRIKNINSSINYLKGLRDSLKILYFKTLDKRCKRLNESVQINIESLISNADTLTNLNSKADLAIGSETFETIWISATSEAIDIKTKGASLLATELGITHIGVFNNSNKFKYIPKLFIGLNIFFRPVERDIMLKTLPKKSSIEIEDNLSAYRTPFHHWSLSLGFTLGKMDVNDFDDFYNSMSMTVGPSYRIYRAFRVSGGLSLLKRINPNPLFNDKKVTTGVYLSTSVDFDFIETIKSFTKLIL